MARLIKWDPFEELERFFSEDFLPALVPAVSFSPVPVNMYEEDGKLVVEVGVPGMKSEDIKVRVEGDRLIVEGKKEEEKEEKGKNYYRREMRRGEFRRVIGLPYEVDPDKANAKVENGVLVVTFPRVAEEKGREIKVE